MVGSTLASRLARTAFTFVNCGCIAHCISQYFCCVSICAGPSMEPTLRSDDVIISERISPRIHQYNYGDIVIFKSIKNPNDLICKRVTGLPGDRIHFRDKRDIPEGHIWLEGDNRENSWDSRDYGPIPQGLIVARVICKIYPVRDITMLTVKSR